MKTFKKLICTILAAVSVLSILDPFFENVSAKEYVNLSDYSQYISLASNEKLTSNQGYIEDGVLYYNVDKTTYGVTGQYYKFGSWSGWSGYSTTYQRAYSQNANTYNGDSVTEKEVRTYQEYRYATRSLKYTYTINLYKKVNGRYQYKTRTSSSGYPWVWDLQVLGWKISSKYASSYYTSWSYGSWQKSTRATSNLVAKVGERTQYSYRTRKGTWTNKYGYVTKTEQRNNRVYYTVTAGNPVAAKTSELNLISLGQSTVIESYYFRAGDMRAVLNYQFDQILMQEETDWLIELKNIVNSYFEIAALYGDDFFNEQYISEDTPIEIPLALVDAFFCGHPKNYINQVMGAVNLGVTLADEYKKSRIYGIVSRMNDTLSSASDNDIIEMSYSLTSYTGGGMTSSFTMKKLNTNKVYAGSESAIGYVKTTKVSSTDNISIYDWTQGCIDYYNHSTFINLGEEFGIQNAYSLKEFIRLAIGKYTGIYFHPTVMDGITLYLSIILEQLLNGNNNSTPTTDSGTGGQTQLTSEEYQKILKESVHNSDANKAMLGKYAPGQPYDYITRAGTEYRYFSLGDSWNDIMTKYGFTNDQMFEMFNKPFLNSLYSEGLDVYFSVNPALEEYANCAVYTEYQFFMNLVDQGTYYWDEIELVFRYIGG